MSRFTVWAPDAQTVEVEAGGARQPMKRAGRPGWWAADVPEAGPGTDYGFVVDGDGPFPDPRSAWQPHGVHGLSRIYDHSRFRWTAEPRGHQLPGSVLYELHIGTFTPEGTFDAAIGRLDHLVRLGVDIVSLMPVAAFPGRHGWGYDGAHLWAVHDPYGGPDGLKRLVDACHQRGLGVFLDVVYNHFGPSGNYLGRYGPYVTEEHRSLWGPAVNFDRPGSDEVRAFVVDNALMWLRDYRIDGLRLDAVHGIVDHRAVHILEELATRAEALSVTAGRPLSLVAESDLNDPRLVTSVDAGGYGLTGQWNDDFHHAVHTVLTGERQGYYRDFGSLAVLAKTLTKVYLHDGCWSTFRGKSHGRPVNVHRTPAHRFVGFLQTHDQVGNRAVGDRLSATLPVDLLKVGAGLVFTAPYVPMIFMGEEWGAGTPWQYFTDHVDPELAHAVSEGRRREFAKHGWDIADVPDPQDPETFRRSLLDWSEPSRPPHRELLEWYRTLVALRKSRPELTDPRLPAVTVDYDESARWLVVHRGDLRIAANVGDATTALPLGAARLLVSSHPDVRVAEQALELPPASFAVVEASACGAVVVTA